MLMLKILKWIVLFPVYLLVSFISFIVNLITGLGTAAVSLFYLFMVIVFAMTIARQTWTELAMAVAISFAVYVATFLVGSVGAMLEALTDWIMGVIVS
ncbi:hypothetical protein QYZ88_015820 [Lachnospiraceae bacterium C1.1]|nr:hypothetical protein [Lachnospiraceae bacterium C1.1]